MAFFAILSYIIISYRIRQRWITLENLILKVIRISKIGRSFGAILVSDIAHISPENPCLETRPSSTGITDITMYIAITVQPSMQYCCMYVII